MNFHVLLCLLISINISARIAYTSELQDDEPEVKCDDRGPACDSTCRKLGSCINMNGELQWYLVQECPIGKFCDAKSNTCSDETTCVAESQTDIACGTDGIFPSPYNCTVYYNCAKCGSDICISGSSTCDPGEGFNACSGECEERVGAKCPYEQTECTAAGQYIVMKENPAMFYLCTLDKDKGIIVPTMFSCTTGIFDISKLECVGSGTECVSATPDPSGSTTTTADPITPIPELCNWIGDKEDSADCRMFYRCSQLNVPPKHYICSLNYYFDKTQLLCVYGTCTNP